MKKWMYLVFPGAMLGLFLVFYFANREEAAEKERISAQRAAEKAEIERKEKAANEEKNRIEAAQRQAQREKEAADKERSRREKQAAADQKIKDDIAEYSGRADRSQKEVSDAEIVLDRLRKEQERLTREAFELARKVEAASVERRNAEMDEERMVEMIVHKTNESSMTRMPQPPPPPPPGRS